VGQKGSPQAARGGVQPPSQSSGEPGRSAKGEGRGARHESYDGRVRLILASASPRRAELLRAAGFVFDVQPPDVDERLLPGEEPVAHVTRLAREKARRAGCGRPEAVVLAADTVVVIDGVVLGKPVDDEEAAGMLRRLSGRTHDVLTGVAVCASGSLSDATERTEVRFAALSDAEIAWYVSTGSPVTRPAPTPSRASPPVSSSASTVLTRTWSGCPWRWRPGC